ncbi:hypothetical protein F5878DRAFT_640557 [Lentinula raphanica]|uniref:Secreted protein n=1 Tax=Lentinula raphanica TaxID=153919 RepID=A0AA38PC77_9AGAR|nr:hypothetical protein F5878DRAFT_640557 [Lentinula raphanica]
MFTFFMGLMTTFCNASVATGRKTKNNMSVLGLLFLGSNSRHSGVPYFKKTMLVTAQLHVPAVWFCIQAETSPSGSHNLDDKLECDIGWREMHGNILYHKVPLISWALKASRAWVLTRLELWLTLKNGESQLGHYGQICSLEVCDVEGVIDEDHERTPSINTSFSVENSQ